MTNAHQEKRYIGPWLLTVLLLGTIAGLGIGYGVHRIGWTEDGVAAFSYGLFLKGVLKWGLHSVLPFLFDVQGPAFARALTGMPVWKYSFGGSVVAGWVLIGWLTRGMLAPRNGLEIVRGAKLHKAARAVASFSKATAPAKAPLLDRAAETVEKTRALISGEVIPATKAAVEFLPGLPFNDDLWRTHMIIYGATGAGKTTAIRHWITQILARPDRLLVFDIKSDFITLYPELSIVDPGDTLSLYWAIASDITTGPEADDFASIVGRGKTDKGDVWQKAQIAVVAGLIIKLQRTKGTAWTWGDLSAALQQSGEDIRSDLETYARAKLGAMPDAEATQAGVIFNIAAEALSTIDGIAQAYRLLEASPSLMRERRFSFREWAVMDRPSHPKIVLRLNGLMKTQSAAFIAAAIDYVAGLLPEIKNQSQVPAWVIADEFANLPKMPKLTSFIEVGRQKGFRLIVGTQQPSQVEQIYGKQGEVFSDQPKLAIVGRAEGKAAKELSEFLGRQDTIQRKASTSMSAGGQSTSLSYQDKSQLVVDPAELGKLGFRDGRIQVYVKTGGEVFELSWPVHSDPKKLPREPYRRWTHMKADYNRLGIVFDKAVAGGRTMSEIVAQVMAASGADKALSDPFTEADIMPMLRLRGMYVGRPLPKRKAFLEVFGGLTFSEAMEAHTLDTEAAKAYVEKVLNARKEKAEKAAPAPIKVISQPATPPVVPEGTVFPDNWDEKLTMAGVLEELKPKAETKPETRAPVVAVSPLFKAASKTLAQEAGASAKPAPTVPVPAVETKATATGAEFSALEKSLLDGIPDIPQAVAQASSTDGLDVSPPPDASEFDDEDGGPDAEATDGLEDSLDTSSDWVPPDPD